MSQSTLIENITKQFRSTDEVSGEETKQKKKKKAKQITVQRDRGLKARFLAFSIVPLILTSSQLRVNTQFKYRKAMPSVATSGSFTYFQSIMLKSFLQLHEIVLLVHLLTIFTLQRYSLMCVMCVFI